LSLVDDLSVDAIAQMTDGGFQPALVVETSPQNFQVWLNHGRTLDRNMGSWAAKELAKRFGGDLSSADWRHFGRLAGFTNRKPERLLPNGLAPFVRLRQCEGRIYGGAHEFLERVRPLTDKVVAERGTHTSSLAISKKNSVRRLAEFHCNPRYAAIYIAPTWLGRCTQRAAVFQNNKNNRSKTNYFTPEIFRRKDGFSAR
jgi:hypothetical protein